MKGVLCFDMDGTLVNLYGVPNWLRQLRAHDVSPYLLAKPMCDMEKLSYILNQLKGIGYEVHIISWLSKDNDPQYARRVRRAKHKWNVFHHFPADKEHYYQYGRDKRQAVKNYNVPCIIFDDDDMVRSTWDRGAAIDPTQTDIIEYLIELLEK